MTTRRRQPQAPDDGGQHVTAGRPGLRTVRAVLMFLLVMFVLLVGVGLMATSPWTRANPDCSIWCVIDEELSSRFSSDD